MSFKPSGKKFGASEKRTRFPAPELTREQVNFINFGRDDKLMEKYNELAQRYGDLTSQDELFLQSIDEEIESRYRSDIRTGEGRWRYATDEINKRKARPFVEFSEDYLLPISTRLELPSASFAPISQQINRELPNLKGIIPRNYYLEGTNRLPENLYLNQTKEEIFENFRRGDFFYR